MMLCYVAVCCVKEHLGVAWRAKAASVYFLIVFRLLIMLYSGHCIHYLFRSLTGEVLSHCDGLSHVPWNSD